MSGGVQVWLSSGESFYVAEELITVLGHLKGGRRHGGFVMVGSRAVNPAQVAEVRFVREIPDIHLPGEQLEQEEEG